MLPLLVLLAFSIAASSAHVVSYDPMLPGCGFPEGPPCYHGNVPSVNCRRSVDPTVCATAQMKTVALKIVTDTGCLMYRWEWNCTTNTLTQCVGEVWCDPRAACNATNASCTCPDKSVVTDDDGGCGCNATNVHLNGTHCLNNTVCELDLELAPPTPTTDRACQNITEDNVNNTGETEEIYEPGKPLFWALIVIAMMLLCVCGCCAYNSCMRRDRQTHPAQSHA